MGKAMYIPATSIESGMLSIPNHDIINIPDTNVVEVIDREFTANSTSQASTSSHLRGTSEVRSWAI